MKRMNATAASIGCFLFMCMAAGFFSATLFGSSEKRYEIRPEITLPEYKTDMDRLTDVYERMIDDYIKVMNQDLTQIHIELQNVSEALDTMSDQLETIQRKLGIEILDTSNQPPAAVPEASEIGGQL